jgi:hypothetical protein
LNAMSKGLVMFAGLLAAPVTMKVPHPPYVKMPQPPDPRLVRLQQFLQQQECPINKFANDFIEAADYNELDWRLLPSISFVESSGGKAYKNNNVFGWDSCDERFPSVRAGIHIVAERLAHLEQYKDKDVDGILRTYNPNLDYPKKVKAIMNRLGSADLGPAIALN